MGYYGVGPKVEPREMAAGAPHAAFVIAASDAPSKVKDNADKVCDGTADQDQFNEAIATFGIDAGNQIQLVGKTFTINGPIVADRALNICGVSGGDTHINLANGSNCNMIELIAVAGAGSALCRFERFKLYGNKTNQAGSLYGIHQAVDARFIDIRFLDIWFDSILGDAISLGNYWNHQIQKCSFEKIAGACIEARISGSTLPTSVHVHDNFVADVENFIKVIGTTTGSGNVPAGWRITNNILSAIKKHVIEVPGENVVIANNRIKTSFDAADTYVVLKINTDQNPDKVYYGVNIHGNQFLKAGSNDALYVIQFAGAEDVEQIVIQGNSFQFAGATVNIKSTIDQLEDVIIAHNNFRTGASANNIDISHAQFIEVASNNFRIGKPILPNANLANFAYHHNIGGSNAGASFQAGDTVGFNTGRASEGSGTATIANGQTHVDVTHGRNMRYPPNIKNIGVTPTNNLGNATKFWISTMGGTTFRIHVDADPGAATATFVWHMIY